jgi:hypothetical protein
VSKVAIVGAGQAGLQLALGLQDSGYDVTVLSNRTAEDIRRGRVMSSQCMFNNSLQTERQLGINFWEEECPDIDGIALAVVGPEGDRVINWEARLDAPAQSVDQRVKMPGWLDEFERRDGDLRIVEVGVPELEELAATHDLVIVAAGKGDVAGLFERNAERSPYDRPQRSLALTYVTGMDPRPTFSAVAFNLIPTVGEYFVFPALTTTGPCDIMVFEGVPGGPMDCWADVSSPQEHLEKSKWVLDTFMPWEAERCQHIALTDDRGLLAGRFPPTVRNPVAELPSGAVVWGMADVVVLNDPITGQGSNNAAKCADHYLEAIKEAGEGPYDRDWMERTFEGYWSYAKDVTRWTNSLLAPPPDHIVTLLGAAGQLPGLARRIANGFDDPPSYFPWWEDPEEASKLVEQEAKAAA